MRKYIERVKDKEPERQKKIITLWAAIITGIIVIIYFTIRFGLGPVKEWNPVFDQKRVEFLLDSAEQEFRELEEGISIQKEAFNESREKAQEYKEAFANDFENSSGLISEVISKDSESDDLLKQDFSADEISDVNSETQQESEIATQQE